MLFIKITPNIFSVVSTSAPSLQKQIFHVRMGVDVQRNWKQLFLSANYSVFIGRGVWHLLILIPHLIVYELPMRIPMRKNVGPTKYPGVKMFDSRNTHEKIFGPTKYPREKIIDPARRDGSMAREPRDA